MRIAVTYENGEVFQHFGHTEQFMVYDVDENVISKKTLVHTNGSGHGALADFLKKQEVDVIVCGGIGGGARQALDEAGIRLYGGVSGEADAAITALMNGSLSFDSNVTCGHHDGHHNGSCGEHGCGKGHACHR